MAVVAAVHGARVPFKFLNSSEAKVSHHRKVPAPAPPVSISTSLSHVSPLQLSELGAICNYSCHRFPNLGPVDGRMEPVSVEKIRKALVHSSVVVSVFSKPEFVSFPSASTASSPSEMPNSSAMASNGGAWWKKLMPLTPSNGRLVGFGRAVSDYGLTASIYDVMVIPSLRRRGIGRMIIRRLLRLLMDRGVYDISVLCSDEQRLFFKACGFGDDILGSTTMIYWRTVSGHSEEHEVVQAGRKTLLIPPLKKSL